MKKLLITIDGPAGAGKTTVSRALADRLGYRYIDTGALYRAVALAAKSRQIDPGDDAALQQLCSELNLEFREINGEQRLFSNGQDVTDYIRTPEVTMLASAVSARPVVRDYLLGLQRSLGARKAAVVEGRDMGTVVFPDADVKFFLSASTEARALRRYEELKQKSKIAPRREDVERDMRQRDKNDSSRKVAPLKAAEDAIVIDSTQLTVDAVVDLMVTHILK
jgi:cytidylate kinase